MSGVGWWYLSLLGTGLRIGMFLVHPGVAKIWKVLVV